MGTEEETPSDFIREIVRADIEAGTYGGRVATRFPPEPNGYLHIGHALALATNFGIAEEFGGTCNLRFDDTNPETEKMEFVEAIQDDVRWLGFDWGDRLFFASDSFEQLYEWAEDLIKAGKAYVCDLSETEISEYRGTSASGPDGKRRTPAGRDSPWRDRSVEENLDLFRRMRKGEFPDGGKTLRARIDMAHPNLNMRDPVMYRILRRTHYRTGDDWCIYPSYDWTHGQSDSIEGITHSNCDVGFENHRPLYDWFLDQLGVHHPKQREFGRLNLTYTVLSKRKLRELVETGCVAGWDDPRMPTLRGLRRRGYTPEGIRLFLRRIGLTKRDRTVEYEMLEHCLRGHLNQVAPRVMGVLNPLRVVIDNYPEHEEEEFEAINNPEDPSAGSRMVPFSRVIYIERDDFREEPHKKFYRLAPGREVRLRYACYITCTDVIKNGQSGEIEEVHCTFDPESRGGSTPDGRKVRGTIHWVSAGHALEAEARLYDRLFTREDPSFEEGGRGLRDYLNPESLTTVKCLVEPGLEGAAAGSRYQFERVGYFCVDPDSNADGLVFNRTVALRDSWSRIEKKSG
jgi:glutaminyl-tRNA synthetase